MLSRYEKKGGFVQLLQLLEGFAPSKREKFLELVRQENSSWADAISARILTFERILSWNNDFVCEVFSRLRPLTVGTCLHALDEDQRNRLMSMLPPAARGEVKEMLQYGAPQAAEVATAKASIVAEVRSLETQGILKFIKIDASLAIPENIEEQLAAGKNGDVAKPSPDDLYNQALQKATGMVKDMLQALHDENRKLKNENEILRRNKTGGTDSKVRAA